MRSSAIGVILAGLSVWPAYAQTVTVTPTAVSVHLGTFFQFSARVTGTSPTTVPALITPSLERHGGARGSFRFVAGEPDQATWEG